MVSCRRNFAYSISSVQVEQNVFSFISLVSLTCNSPYLRSGLVVVWARGGLRQWWSGLVVVWASGGLGQWWFGLVVVWASVGLGQWWFGLVMVWSSGDLGQWWFGLVVVWVLGFQLALKLIKWATHKNFSYLIFKVKFILCIFLPLKSSN